MIREVEIIFDRLVKEALRDRINGTELIRCILNHEKKPLVLKNLCREVELYEKRHRTDLKTRSREDIVGAGVELFLAAAQRSADDNYVSDAERFRRTSDSKERQAMKEMQDVIKERDPVTGELSTIEI